VSVAGDRSQAPAGSRREATKQANRGAILDAARAVFAEMGYGAATVRDVIRRTDLASGTFYNYFPDKEAVLRALLEDIAREARRLTRAARRESTTLEEFVADGFRAYFELLAGDPATFLFVRRNAGTIRSLFDDPAIWAGAHELSDDLREAIDAGAMGEFDTEYMAAAMVGAGFELAVRLLERDPPDVDGATRFATDLFLGGIERIGGRGGRT
jgi:AcrR family transcriptional regulator